MIIKNVKMYVYVLLLVFSTALHASKTYTTTDLLTKINGKKVKAKKYSLNIAYYVYKYQTTTTDQLSVIIDKGGFIRLQSKIMAGSYLFKQGEVDGFLKVLQKSLGDAKYVKRTKKSGLFKIGSIGNDIVINLAAFDQGEFDYIALLTKSPRGPYSISKRIEHRLTINNVKELISILSNKDKSISELSGESDGRSAIKLSMSDAGSSGASGGLTLKVEKKNHNTVLIVKDVKFKTILSKKEVENFRLGLKKASAYLSKANSSGENPITKDFILSVIKGKNVIGSIKKLYGDNTYKLSIKITSINEKKPRWAMISHKHLILLLKYLK